MRISLPAGAGLIGSTATANILMLVSTGLAVRAIGAAEYADYNFYSALAALIAVAAASRLDYFLLSRAALRPHRIFWGAAASIILVTCAALLTAVLIHILEGNARGTSSKTLLVGIVAAATAFQSLTTNSALRSGGTLFLNASRVARGAILLLLVALLLSKYPSASAFMAVTAVATFAPLIWFRWPWRELRCIQRPSPQTLRDAAHFARYNLPAAAIGTFNLQIPLLLFVWIYAQSDAGEAGLAYKLITLPLSLIGVALAQLVTISYHKHNDLHSFRPTYQTALRRLSLAAILAGVFIASLPWQVITRQAFPEMEDLHRFIVLVAPILVLSTISTPISGLVTFEGRVRYTFWISLFEVVIRCGAIILARIVSNDPGMGLAAFSIASAAISLNYIIYTTHVVMSDWQTTLRTSALVVGPLAVAISLLASNGSREILQSLAVPVALLALGLTFWMRRAHEA